MNPPSTLYRQILTAASFLDGVPLEELDARYPEGEFFALRDGGQAHICTVVSDEDAEERGNIAMKPVVTVPEHLLGLDAEQVRRQVLKANRGKEWSELCYQRNALVNHTIKMLEDEVARREGALLSLKGTVEEKHRNAVALEERITELERLISEDI